MPKKTIQSLLVSAFWSLLLVIISLTWLCIGCQSRSTVEQPDGDAARWSHPCGISMEMLKKAELQLAWTTDLPMGRAGRLKQIFYHNSRLYALNDHNVLYALNGDNGIIDWSVTLAAPKLHCFPVQYYKESLIFVLGNTFVQVRQSDGSIIKKLQINRKYPVSTSAARSEDRIFLGSLNKRFYSLRLADGIPIWQNVCRGEPLGTITVTSEKVYFVTGDNTLYVSAARERDLVWKFQAAGDLCGVVVDNDQCLLPSEDTTLYCFDPQNGKLLWKHLAGGSLLELPVLTETAIYQPVGRESLLCLERHSENENGTVRWVLDNGLCLLAENGQLSYVMTRNNELAVMDNLSKKRRLSFYIPNMDLYAKNNENPLILLGSKTGKLLALKPTKERKIETK